jgi:hypothetical protein
MLHKQNINELIGIKFNRLTVLKKSENKIHNRLSVDCKCDCGNLFSATINSLKTGNTKSCGCIRIEKPNQLKHGLRSHKLFNVYSNIKQRCYNGNSKNFNNYGGRGITICDEWKNSFINFYNWCINNGWNADLEIDRMDNNGNYSPNNCRCVSRVINVRNRRNTLKIIFNNQEKSLSEWADIIGVSYSTLSQRIFKLKIPLEKAMSKKVFRRKHIKSWQK